MKTRKRTASRRASRDDFDGAWKEVVEEYLREFFDFFFPAASAGIDWARGYRFLDKELQKITPRGAVRKGVVDKLFEAYSIGGEEWLLAVHLEVQNNPIPDLPERVFEYHYRIYEKLKRPVASLLLLTDTRADWRPDRFERETLGCKITLEFPMAKLSDFDTPEFIHHPNPFSFVVRAHRRAQASSGDPLKRYDLRYALEAELAEEINQEPDEEKRLILHRRYAGIIKFIEVVMQLPDELEDKFIEEMTAQYGEKVMEIMTYRERKAATKAEIKSILRVLSKRFGEIPNSVNEAVSQIEDSILLEQLIGLAVTCVSIDEFERAIPESVR